MKKAAVIAAAAMMLVSAAGAAEVELTMDFASSYVFRGVTFNDGMVVQPGIGVSGLPVSFGVWANFDLDDAEGALEGTEFSEVDIYLGYDLPVDLEPVSLSLGYTEYTYPSGGGDADREVSLAAGFDTFLSPAIGVYYGLHGAIEESVYVELSGSYERELPWEVTGRLGAALGYMAPKDGKSGLSHADITAEVSYGDVAVGIQYIAEIDNEVLAGYDREFVATLSASRTF